MEKIIDVYIQKINEKSNNLFLPNFLVEELKKITNERLKKQKLTAYSLLYFGAYNSYNLELLPNDVIKDKNGKPKCNFFEFSISHSNDLVVLAISKNKVGVDLELIKNNRDYDVIKNKYFLEKEKNLDFYSVWTNKESIFKYLNKKHITLREIDSTKYKCKNCKVLVDGDTYALSVCAKKIGEVNYINLDNLKVY